MKILKFIFSIMLLMIFVVACSQPQTSAPTPAQTPAQNTPPPAANKLNSGNSVSVAIQGFKFSPADINVKVGDTVIWTNKDSAPHTVESSDGTLKSDELSKGDTYKFTFTKAGKYDYICGIHKSMHGSVTVQ